MGISRSHWKLNYNNCFPIIHLKIIQNALRGRQNSFSHTCASSPHNDPTQGPARLFRFFIIELWEKLLQYVVCKYVLGFHLFKGQSLNWSTLIQNTATYVQFHEYYVYRQIDWIDDFFQRKILFFCFTEVDRYFVLEDGVKVKL